MNPFTVAQIPYFDQSEFECECCLELKLAANVLYFLFAMRVILKHPIYIVSGYRCRKHNVTIKGAHKNSQHVYGQAADIYVSCVDYEHVIETAKLVGFTRVYVMKDKGSIHCGL